MAKCRPVAAACCTVNAGFAELMLAALLLVLLNRRAIFIDQDGFCAEAGAEGERAGASLVGGDCTQQAR